ncbi:MAG: NUDIX domain-containing protein [Thermoleophilia bacterium]|nr:NUDIX domain-containing protein [Thermoleophilia bacterium]
MRRSARFYYHDRDAPAPNRPRALSVVALIERDGTLLLEHRTDAALWSLIAGMVEDDETLTDALRREVREETGLELTAVELFGTFSDPTRIVSYPDGNVFRVVSVAYSVAVASFAGLRASEESEALRFFPLAELPFLALPATQRPIVDRLLTGGPPPHLE